MHVGHGGYTLRNPFDETWMVHRVKVRYIGMKTGEHSVKCLLRLRGCFWPLRKGDVGCVVDQRSGIIWFKVDQVRSVPHGLRSSGYFRNVPFYAANV